MKHLLVHTESETMSPILRGLIALRGNTTIFLRAMILTAVKTMNTVRSLIIKQVDFGLMLVVLNHIRMCAKERFTRM